MLINSFSNYSRVLSSVCPLLVDRDYNRSICVFVINLIGFPHEHRVVRTNSRVILDIESSPLIATYLRILVRALIGTIFNTANTVYSRRLAHTTISPHSRQNSLTRTQVPYLTAENGAAVTGLLEQTIDIKFIPISHSGATWGHQEYLKSDRHK